VCGGPDDSRAGLRRRNDGGGFHAGFGDDSAPTIWRVKCRTSRGAERQLSPPVRPGSCPHLRC